MMHENGMGYMQIELHDVHQRSHFTMVSIIRYVNFIASGWFSHIRSHICLGLEKTDHLLLGISPYTRT